MANNFINRGEVLVLPAMGDRESGKAYREHGFNGVALIDAGVGETFTLQVRGVFEFALADVKIGELIYIDPTYVLIREHRRPENVAPLYLYGRAATPTDSDGNFHCMILQSE